VASNPNKVKRVLPGVVNGRSSHNTNINPFTAIKRQNTFFRDSLAATSTAMAETADTKRIAIS
jgi:hypothetical protein